jgi:PKD repeat protein
MNGRGVRALTLACTAAIAVLLGANSALPQPTASTVAAAATLTFAPIADATVKQANPTSNYGTSTTLSILGGTTKAMHSYLKFTVSGVSNPSAVSSVTLRLYVTDRSVDGGKVFSVSNNWLETGKGKITWNNAPLPAAGAVPLAPSAGTVAAGTWVSFSLPVSTFGANGTYSVMLASDSSSDSAGFASREASTAANRPQLVLALTSQPPPTAAFNADKTSGDAPLVVTYTDASTGSPTSWAWNFGDQTTSNVQNPPPHTYSTAGDYTVTLTASNAGGSSSAQQTIHVTAPVPVPIADFTWAANYLAVTFTDASTNNPTAWAWDFGDGYTSVQQDPIHTYAKAGTYNVTLTATNGAGPSTPVAKSVTVTAPPAPTASFTPDKSSGLVPLTVSFTDTSSGSPTSWQWDFGDNTGSTQQSPKHTYNAEGTFTVTLTASNAGGSTTAKKTITVTAPPPTASFTVDKSSGDAPLTITFIDTSTGNPTSWLWNFGDGTPSSTSTLQSPIYQYINPGTYTVTLIASNANGSSNPATATITVTDNGTITTVTANGIWISPAELAKLPTSGASWDSVKSRADSSWGSANLSNQDSTHPVSTLAGALVYARTGDTSYRDKVIAALNSIKGTEAGSQTLALGRNLAAYAIAADLVGYGDASLKSYLSGIRNFLASDGKTLIQCNEVRPNNWGTMCGASRIAIDLYLDDRTDLDRAAKVFHGWVGDLTSYTGFQFGDLCYQADPANPVGINKLGATRDGYNLDGALPDDQRRSGCGWPPAPTSYVWGALSAAVAQAEMLSRSGYDAFNWENQALRRAAVFATTYGQPVSNASAWAPWIVNFRYGTSFSTQTPTAGGRLLAFADWTHGPGRIGS